jgi:hypothetical protein
LKSEAHTPPVSAVPATKVATAPEVTPVTAPEANPVATPVATLEAGPLNATSEEVPSVTAKPKIKSTSKGSIDLSSPLPSEVPAQGSKPKIEANEQANSASEKTSTQKATADKEALEAIERADKAQSEQIAKE